MKNLLIALAALVAVGCSKSPKDIDVNNPDTLKGTVWVYENGTDESSTTMDFKSSELAILTLSTFVEIPDTHDLYPGPTYKEERVSNYFYDYVVSDGKIYLTVSTTDSYSFNGIHYIIPADRFDMPALIGSVSSDKLLLLKDTGEIYATLGKK
jgi:hypothetical protein